jgi:plasmid replication initiation protein
MSAETQKLILRNHYVNIFLYYEIGGNKRMENKVGGYLICKRPETIVEARFNLTKKQNDILDIVLASIGDDGKLEYKIDLTKYSKIYNIKDKSNIYRDFKKAVHSFEGKGFSITQKISDKKEKRIYFAWFSRIIYLDDESCIFVGIDPMLKELMLNAKKACFYQLKYPINFHNIYSKRIYYYLKSFENSNGNGTGWRLDNLDNLREKLECPKSYNVYYEFKRYVLKPAYDEINGSSDISFEYEEIKTKRKVTHLKFSIKKNNLDQLSSAKDEIAVALSSDNEESTEKYIQDVKTIIQNVIGIQISEKSANEIYKCAIKHAQHGNVPLELIREVAEHSKTQNIKGDYVIWFKGTVLKYEKPIKVTQQVEKGTFIDYEQRAYDFDELEKKLLEWDKPQQTEGVI